MLDDNQKNIYAIITGAAGSIGQATVRVFEQAGYAVIATDRSDLPENLPCKHFMQVDLQKSVTNEDYAKELFTEIRKQLDGAPLKVLVNNAATQILGKVENLTRNDWRTTLDVNLLAPFFWTQAFLPELGAAGGSVINISSIHARLTKREFAAYATSKAALSGLTRSLALEVGDRIRVNAIEPAAIDTAMLRAGFEEDSESFTDLKRYHPTQKIGTPEEVAKLALSLASDELPFMNGATIQLDGGIGGCLHDPY